MGVRVTWSPGSHSRGSARWPVPRQPSWVPSPQRVSSRGRRGPRGRARGGVQGGTPLASDASPTPAPWHRGAYGEVSFLEAGRCQAAGLQGFSRCRDPWTGRPRQGEGASGRAPRDLLGRPAGVRPSARLPAGVPPPSPGPPSATHRFPGCSRAARWTRSAPPPRPPEALLPPRGPRAQPPPGARPRSASPCAATRPGRWGGGRGRALRVAELSAAPPPGAGANPCARALASRSSPRTVSVMNSQVHPHGGVGLLFKPVPLFSILVSRADSPVLYSFIFFIPRVLHRLSIRLPPHPHPTHLLV